MDGAMFIPEFEHEAALTRKTLERVPLEQGDWKPHEKSFTLRQLASHLATIPSWTAVTLKQDELDMDPEDQAPQFDTRDAMLDAFDHSVEEARQALADTSGEQLMGTWTLKSGGQTVLSMPRVAVLRGFVLNHAVHHRAQLGVYLRLLDVPVPSIYGPSADEAE
ncbi:DinB family protein [Gaopeijia maritima]|uniref:DinB family protein n=1 Tax=Gaopeijia maritima TaxID=3119007 RepID=A0ABU9E926_9BACT